MHKTKPALFLFIALLISLVFGSLGVALPRAQAEGQLGGITNPTDCAAAGGSWTTVAGGGAPVSICSCPGANVVLDGACVSAEQAACVLAGGNWTTVAGGGTPIQTCVCPDGDVLNGGRCVEPETDGADVGNELELVEGGEGEKLFEYLQTGINLLTALAGIAITGAVIFAGIQYSTAGGNPQAAAQAKGRIINAMIALLALLFLYAFFQWLVPGGIFGN